MSRSWCVSYQTTPWDYHIIRTGWRWVLWAEHYELEEFSLLRHFDIPRDFFRQILRLCSPSTWSFWLASRASFRAHRVSFRPFQQIEICSGMPHWGIFPSHHFLIVRRSEPPSLFSFSVQSHHHHFLVWRSESHSQIGVQSHHRILVGVHSHHFRVVRRSEPPSLFSFGVQSHHHHFLVWRFDLRPRFRRSEPCFASFGVQSHHRLPVLAFKAIVSFSFDVQSRSLLIILAFRAIIAS